MEIISRRNAGIRGDTYFYTGKECVNGHTSPRYVSTGTCKECGNTSSRKYSAKHHGRDAIGMIMYRRNVIPEFVPQLDALLSALELQYSIDTAKAIQQVRQSFLTASSPMPTHTTD
jgi:hypothetical protein